MIFAWLIIFLQVNPIHTRYHNLWVIVVSELVKSTTQLCNDLKWSYPLCIQLSSLPFLSGHILLQNQVTKFKCFRTVMSFVKIFLLFLLCFVYVSLGLLKNLRTVILFSIASLKYSKVRIVAYQTAYT